MKKFIKKAFKCAAKFNDNACVHRVKKVQKNHIDYMYNVVNEEIKELRDSETFEDELDACVDIFYFCLTIADALKLKNKVIDFINYSLIHEGKKWQNYSNNKQSLLNLICNALYKGTSHKDELIRYLSFYIIASNLLGSTIGSFKKAFEAVHVANMSKFVKDKDKAWDGGRSYLNKGKVTWFSVVKNEKELYFSHTGIGGWKRVLKPAGWVAPDLTHYTY